MASYVKKIRKLDKEDCGFVLGDCETELKGNKSYRMDKKREYFSNDSIDIWTEDKDGNFSEKIIGKDRKKYKYQSPTSIG